MRQKRVLLAGASGCVGFEVLQLLQEEACEIHTLSRSKKRAQKCENYATKVHIANAMKPKSLVGICEDMDLVVSCLGASVGLHAGQRAAYFSVDYQANLNLLHEAKRAGVKRFLYLSVQPSEGYAHTKYVQAHLAFEKELERSGLDYSIVRPTGLYTAFDDLVDMAKRGPIFLIGKGDAKTNPVDHRDVAEVLVKHLWEGPEKIPVGGPDIVTRKEIGLRVFEALDKKPRFLSVPAWGMRFGSLMLRWLHPRLSQLLEFAVAVNISEATAPKVGKRGLLPYFSERSAP